MVSDDSSSYYDVFAPADSDAGGEKHQYIPVYPVDKGANLAGYPNAGENFTFNIPQGVYDLASSFFTVDGNIYSTGTTRMSAYDPDTVTTHATVQNNACSFFKSMTLQHNQDDVEIVNEPGKVETIDALTSQFAVARGYEDSDFTYLERCKTFDAAGGSKYSFPLTLALGTVGANDSHSTGKTATPVTVVAPNASSGTAKDLLVTSPFDNTTNYDPSFEKRCKITTANGAAEFQITGRLPFSMFKYRSGATVLNSTRITMTRDADTAILENRTTTTVTSVSISNITLWMHQVRPNLSNMATIQAGIAAGKKQTIAGKYWKYIYQNVAASESKSQISQQLVTVPSKIYVGFLSTNQKSKRSWNHQDVAQVTCAINSIQVNSQVVRVNDWTNKRDARALYEHFLSSTGQGGYFGEPTISFDQFVENYCLWAFDTSSSVTGMLDLAKKPAQMQIESTYQTGGGAAAAMIMEVFLCYDGAYTISGPQDKYERLY